MHEDENIFLCPCRKESISKGCSLKAVPILSAFTVECTYCGTRRTRGVRLLNVPPQTAPLLNCVLTCDISLWFCIQQMVNSTVLYAAIMTLWLVALPGFLNLSHFPGIFDVMSLVITAAPSLLILCSAEAVLIAQ